jgi:hypothetical protein
MNINIVPGQKLPIAGVAFAGDRGISKVEVSTDDGTTWKSANIKDPLSQYTWVYCTISVWWILHMTKTKKVGITLPTSFIKQTDELRGDLLCYVICSIIQSLNFIIAYSSDCLIKPGSLIFH